jgi:hypothetical protein
VGCRDALVREHARDVGEATTAGVLETDSLDDPWTKRRRPTGRTAPSPTARRREVVAQEALKLVDRDEPLAPGQLDGIDRRNDAAVDSRDTHPERLSGLAASVGESSDLLGLVNILRRGGGTRLRFVEIARVLARRRPSSPVDTL